MRALKSWLVGLFGGAMSLCLAASAQPYTLVQGLDKFDGSMAAWHLLETNGFVVTDPAFKQIFEPYLDDSLPAFITVDSAWHAYHVLLEEGTRQVDLTRSQPLADFLRRLWTNVTDPKIPGRMFPSGLDFFVASPSLRSPAAERALRAAEGGAVVEAVRKAEAGPLPDSLSGRALGLLAALQTALPVRVGPAMRSQAWAEAQLWTQLGAWAEEQHAGARPGRLRIRQGPGDKAAASAGVVAPYPEFFSGLGGLALDTAVAFEKAGLDEPFDAKTTARQLLECILWQKNLGEKSQAESERMDVLMEQFGQFSRHFLEARPAEQENNPAASLQTLNDWEILARRCSTQTAPAETDRQVLLSFYQQRQTAPKMLRDFVPVCDELAELARKHLEGMELTEEDKKWIGGYGMTLARFLFHVGNSPEALGDDFPIVTRLQSNPARQAVLYAGLGRPQALYIILPTEGRLRLYRGAVLTYREFVRTNDEPLDDASWRAIARTGEIPPPPAFTRSFRAERDAAELLKTLASFNFDTAGYNDIAQVLEELQSRVTDRDLPALLSALGQSQASVEEPVSDGIASAIAGLHWEPHQRELFALLEKGDGEEGRLIAPILLQRPAGLDGEFLSTNFEHAPARARRVYCALLSRIPPTDQTRESLLRALSDSAPAVRWEAASVLGAAAGNVPQKTAPLLERLNDDNEYVAAAAAAALGRLRAKEAAPALLSNLVQRLQKPEPSMEELRQQNEAVRDFPLFFADQPRGQPNTPAPFNFMRMRRFPGGLALRGEEAPAAAALLETLGDLRYQPAEERIFSLLDGPHAASAAKALKQLAPDKLARRLVAEACDKKADPQSRDRALLLLGTSPGGGSATDLIPLLDDTTVVPGRRPMPGREWRICDRAASAISTLLGHSVQIMPMQSTDQRDAQIEQIRQSLKAAY